MPRRYVEVDLSVDHLRDALDQLQRRHPALDMVGVGQDFSHTLALPDAVGAVDAGPRVLFYPGSSIGNFTPAQALAFLRQVHAACGTVAGSGLLVGVDLVKDAAELDAAYDDALGVTAAFNRNLLSHVNRLCGSNFALADWGHLARYNSALSRIEMHLQARRAVQVRCRAGVAASHKARACTPKIPTNGRWPRSARCCAKPGLARRWSGPMLAHQRRAALQCCGRVFRRFFRL